MHNWGLKIKIVERTGTNLKKVLQRSNPFKNRLCARQDCFVCTTGGQGPCGALGVTYEIVCKRCLKKYIGETARNAYTRGKEHLNDLERESERSVLMRHAEEDHEGMLPEYTMSVTGVFANDAMMRQISESVQITKNGTINNKTEWNHLKIPRAVIDK